MTYIIFQALEAFMVFVFLTVGINLVKISSLPCLKSVKISDFFKSEFYKTISISTYIGIISFILALLTTVLYIYDIFCLNYLSEKSSFFKLFLFVMAVIVYFVLILPYFKNFKVHGIYTLTVIICGIMAFTTLASILDSNAISQQYNQNVIVQTPKITTNNYELICLNDTIDLEASYEGSLSGNIRGGLFAVRGSIESYEKGELKITDVYKLYYLADSSGKILPITLNVDDTPLYYTKDGEAPYLAKITTMQYSLDYNVNPPKECNFKEPQITYELHIPKGSIVENITIDLK